MGLKAVEEIQKTEVMDNKTGELETTEIKRNVSIVGHPSEEPNYVKLYLQAWCSFKQIKGINSGFLYEILQYMSYADKGQRIYLNSFAKKEIASSLGWSKKSALTRCNVEMKKLVDKNVLKKIARDVHAVNPELIGKGNWADVKKFRAVFNLIGNDAGKVEPVME